MKKLFTIAMAMVGMVMANANTFTKMTVAPEDWSGQYLIAWDAKDSVVILNGVDAAGGYVKATATDGVITSNELDDYVVELAKVSGGYSVKWMANGKYLTGSSGGNVLSFVSDPATSTIEFRANGDTVLITAGRTLLFNATSGQNRFRYYNQSNLTGKYKNDYKAMSLYKVGTEIAPDTWVPDTLSVTQARELIKNNDSLMNKSHYIKGVVSSENYGKQWPGWAMIWMTDVENLTDSLEGYKIYKDGNSTQWKNMEEIPCGYGDTILVYADGLALYQEEGKNPIYETTSGYFVKVLGKANFTDLSNQYTYGYAQMTGAKEDRFGWEITLQPTPENVNGIKFDILNSTDKGIAGAFTMQPESQYYVESASAWKPASGMLKLTYAGTNATGYNNYIVNSMFSSDGKQYRILDTLELPGYDAEWAEIVLSDDVPYIPEEGDTISCAVAQEYAKTLGSNKGVKVYIRGFATGFATVKGRSQQSVYMNDTKGATKGIAEGYLCYTQDLDSIVKGDEVLIYGEVTYYAQGEIAEITKGQIYRIGGSNTQRLRNITLEQVPDDAITVAEAMAIGNALEAAAGETVSTDKEYTVKGYIAKVSYQTSNDSATWFMTDVKGERFGDLQAYRCAISELIAHGDYVYVTGYISKYSGSKVSIEISKGRAAFTDAPVGIENVKSVDSVNVEKFFRDGQLYIRKDGVLYNAQGMVVE